MKINELKLNDGTHGLPKNPRFIRDDRFRALCDSIRDNPEYMPARPIIINEAGVILGGNMRFRACKDLGMSDIPDNWVMRVTDWPIDKQRRFIILDNRGFGEDDMEALANEWDVSELIAGGFTEADFTGFKDQESEPKSKDPGNPRSVITFPPRVWLTQRESIIAELAKIVDAFGGAAEWAN